MIDPRTSIITERLARIRRIIAVSSGKGGVGKSMVATALALISCKRRLQSWPLRLRFYWSLNSHNLRGTQNRAANRRQRYRSSHVEGLEYMSLVYYVGDKPAPLRGADVSNALIELLSVTQWGELDFLIIDMPPGIGDAVLDLVRLVNRIEFLIITTPSMLAFEVVKKQVALLCELKMPIVGIIENMKMDKSTGVQVETEKLGLKYLGAIPYDPQVESTIGNPVKLLETKVARIISQFKKSTKPKK